MRADSEQQARPTLLLASGFIKMESLSAFQEYGAVTPSALGYEITGFSSWVLHILPY